MKKNRLIIVTFLIFLSCKQKSELDQSSNKTIDAKEIKTNLMNNTLGMLQAKKNKINYGGIKRGDTIWQDFIFYNKGKEKVHIINYTPSCNCTSSFLEKKDIFPADSVKFTMVIDTSNKRTGPNEVTTTIKTDGKRNFHFLSVRFDILD